MNCIYDILLNFNEEFYEFYDWNKEDSILHIRRIPLMKVSTLAYKEIKTSDIKCAEEILNKIKDRTDLFNKKLNDKFKYACILSDGLSAMAVRFDGNGKLKERSSMLLDEELEVLELVMKTSESEINYKVLLTKDNHKFRTRKEKQVYNYLKKELKKLKDNNMNDEINYLNYECFNNESNDECVIHKINESLDKDFDNISPKLLNFFELISTNRK